MRHAHVLVVLEEHAIRRKLLAVEGDLHRRVTGIRRRRQAPQLVVQTIVRCRHRLNVRRIRSRWLEAAKVHRSAAEAAATHDDTRGTRYRPTLEAQVRHGRLSVEHKILGFVTILLCVVRHPHLRSAGAPCSAQLDTQIVESRVVRRFASDPNAYRPVLLRAPLEKQVPLQDDLAIAHDAQTTIVKGNEHQAFAAQLDQVIH